MLQCCFEYSITNQNLLSDSGSKVGDVHSMSEESVPHGGPDSRQKEVP